MEIKTTKEIRDPVYFTKDKLCVNADDVMKAFVKVGEHFKKELKRKQ